MRYLVIRQLLHEQACYIEPTTCNLVIITAVEILVWVKRMNKIFVFLVPDSVQSHTFRCITLISVSLWTHTMALEEFKTLNITGNKWCLQFYLLDVTIFFSFFYLFHIFWYISFPNRSSFKEFFKQTILTWEIRTTGAYTEMWMYCIINIVARAYFGHLIWASSGRY